MFDKFHTLGAGAGRQWYSENLWRGLPEQRVAYEFVSMSYALVVGGRFHYDVENAGHVLTSRKLAHAFHVSHWAAE